MKHRIAVLALAALAGLLAGSAAMADELPYRITDTLVGSTLTGHTFPLQASSRRRPSTAAS